MVITLLTGVVLPFSINWVRRGRFCSEKAKYHAKIVRALTSSLDRCRTEVHRHRVAAQAIRDGSRYPDNPEAELTRIVASGYWWEESERHAAQRVHYHAELETSYFWAAYLPWVEPGPVSPEPTWDGQSTFPVDRAVTLPSREPLILGEAEKAKLSAISTP